MRKTAPVISLFPFLNVLICVLGVLIMIVLAVSALSLGPGRTVRINIEQDDANLALKPVYIAWDGQTVTLYPDKIQIAGDEALENNGRNESLFGAFLDRLEVNQERQYVIAAIRPSGFHNFSELRRTILDRGIRIGYEPIDQDWELDAGT